MTKFTVVIHHHWILSTVCVSYTLMQQMLKNNKKTNKNKKYAAKSLRLSEQTAIPTCDLWRMCGGRGLIPKFISWKLLWSCESTMSFHNAGNKHADSIKKRLFLVQLNTCTRALMRKCYLLTLSTSGSSCFTFALKKALSSVLAKLCKIIIHNIQLRWKAI